MASSFFTWHGTLPVDHATLLPRLYCLARQVSIESPFDSRRDLRTGYFSPRGPTATLPGLCFAVLLWRQKIRNDRRSQRLDPPLKLNNLKLIWIILTERFNGRIDQSFEATSEPGNIFPPDDSETIRSLLAHKTWIPVRTTAASCTECSINGK